MKKVIALALASTALVGARAPRARAPRARVRGAASPPSFTVIAAGLNNPRGLAVTPDGAVYVAEAGSGGAGPCVKGESGPSCFGSTGAIVRIRNGRWSRVRSGLPSVAAGGMSASGPSDVTVAPDGSMSSIVQGVDLQTPATSGPRGTALQHLLHVTATGALQMGPDFYAYMRRRTTRMGERSIATRTHSSRRERARLSSGPMIYPTPPHPSGDLRAYMCGHYSMENSALPEALFIYCSRPVHWRARVHAAYWATEGSRASAPALTWSGHS